MKGRYQYSKKIPIITGIMFLGLTLISLFCSNEISWNIGITAISVSGGIFASSIIWYLKKSQVENSFKLRCMEIDKASKVRIDFIESILLLKQRYNVSDQEIFEIEQQSPIDEMENMAFNRLATSVDQFDTDGHSQIQN